VVSKNDSFDAYIFVTAEYNHGIPRALKNAIDFLFMEWNNKVAGFVSYGGVGGVRAVEQLRLVIAELKVATVRTQVQLSLYTPMVNLENSISTRRKGLVLMIIMTLREVVPIRTDLQLSMSMN
jgi:NAD(P)H-dependent FMN reductase